MDLELTTQSPKPASFNLSELSIKSILDQVVSAVQTPKKADISFRNGHDYEKFISVPKFDVSQAVRIVQKLPNLPPQLKNDICNRCFALSYHPDKDICYTLLQLSFRNQPDLGLMLDGTPRIPTQDDETYIVIPQYEVLGLQHGFQVSDMQIERYMDESFERFFVQLRSSDAQGDMWLRFWSLVPGLGDTFYFSEVTVYCEGFHFSDHILDRVKSVFFTDLSALMTPPREEAPEMEDLVRRTSYACSFSVGEFLPLSVPLVTVVQGPLLSDSPKAKTYIQTMCQVPESLVEEDIVADLNLKLLTQNIRIYSTGDVGRPVVYWNLPERQFALLYRLKDLVMIRQFSQILDNRSSAVSPPDLFWDVVDMGPYRET